MKFRNAAFAAALLCTPALVHAQDMPVQAAVSHHQVMTIPAGLAVPLTLTSELSSSRNREGETVALTVTSDVMADGILVIPRGTPVTGEITLRSGRGMFGKSGKLEISFRYMELGGVRVPLEGAHMQGGRGNTAATVGAIVAAGLIGGAVVTGRSANLEEGSTFTARTLDALPVMVRPAGHNGAMSATAQIDASYAPSAILTGSPHRLSEQADAAERRRTRTPVPSNESCADRGRRLSSNHSIAREIEQRCMRQRNTTASR